MAAETFMENSPKRSRTSGDDDEIDRLSNLPGNILHHILSFLDTKYTVQTSVLARRWRCLWKDVSVLKFSGFSFHDDDESGFTNHVRKFLTLRFDSATVTSIDMGFGFGVPGKKMALELFDSVLNHAGAPSRGRNLHHLSMTTGTDDCGEMVGCIITYGHHESLETLKLAGSEIKVDSFAGFKLLASLELRECCFCSTGEPIFDPFSSLPRLSHLKLLDCRTSSSSSSNRCLFVVSGSQLLDLEIRVPRVPLKVFKLVEVSAPNLKSFVFELRREDLKKRLKWNLPSLDHAYIRLWWSDVELLFDPYPLEVTKKHNRAYMNLLRGLCNAKSLVLCFSQEWWKQPWEHDHLPLTNLKHIMKSEASPFTRLEKLRVQYNRPRVPKIPYQVIRYFFEGSTPNAEEKSVQLEMIADYYRRDSSLMLPMVGN